MTFRVRREIVAPAEFWEATRRSLTMLDEEDEEVDSSRTGVMEVTCSEKATVEDDEASSSSTLRAAQAR